jgi:putative endopeptidase
MNASFTELSEFNDSRFSDIIDEILAGNYKRGTKEQKIVDFYRCFMDHDSQNIGIAPIKNYLNAIDDADSLSKLVDLGSELQKKIGVGGLFSFDSDSNILGASDERIFYFLTVTGDRQLFDLDDESKVDAFRKYIRTVFELGGETNNYAEKYSNLLLKAEKKLTDSMLSSADSAVLTNVYTISNISDIDFMFPYVNIRKVAADLGFRINDSSKIMLAEENMVRTLGKYMNPANIDILKAYMKFEILSTYGAYLSSDFADAANAFLKKFTGMVGDLAAKEKAVEAIENFFGNYVNEIYVKKYVPENIKTDVENIVHDIIEAYKVRIKNLDWMSEATKERAILKLEKIAINVAYPDKWDDPYADFDVKPLEDGGSMFDFYSRYSELAFERTVENQDKPIDKNDNGFGNMACVVNAFYDPSLNAIFIPCGVLGVPFYDETRSKTENFAAIGAVVGHEISHAFDNNGAKFDENGDFINWWTEDDYRNFAKKCDEASGFYDNLEIIPNVFSNGKLTISENIADLGGVSVALDCAEKEPSFDAKSFFESYAKMWRATSTKDFLKILAICDVHANARFRVNKTVQNFDEFYDAFKISELDGMYMPNSKRITIW